MAKYNIPPLKEDGSTIEIYPKMDRPYQMQCCDCGLVHDFYFNVVKETDTYPDGTFEVETIEDKSYRVEMVVARNNRSTGQVRRYRNTE